jgi:hypothetical protein
MKRKITARVALLAALMFMTGLLTAIPAYAAQCGGTNTYFDWGDCSQGGNPVMAVVISIFNWLAIGVTIVVIGAVIYGGIMYSSSGGNPEQAKKAMGVIRGAIIALILYFAMFAVLNFLVPGGLFT